MRAHELLVCSPPHMLSPSAPCAHKLAWQVDTERLELSLMGRAEAVLTAEQWLTQRCHELVLQVDQRGALSLLLKNKAAALTSIKKSAKLGGKYP